jgi:hypothetical protein
MRLLADENRTTPACPETLLIKRIPGYGTTGGELPAGVEGTRGGDGARDEG